MKMSGGMMKIHCIPPPLQLCKDSDTTDIDACEHE